VSLLFKKQQEKVVMSDSTQHKLSKIRPPRVQLTYDVETGGAVEPRSLDFVVGVVADLCPAGPTADKALKERKFVEVDKENLSKVMSSLKPSLKLSVENKLTGDGSNMRLELAFSQMKDFSPEGVAEKVPALAKLMETRRKLNDLLAKLEGNDGLNDLLSEVVLNTEVREKALAQVREDDTQQKK
jgi:type VI secretion system protein ImpB